MQLSRTKLAILALILANIIWGAAFPIYKWALKDLQPFTFGFLRFFFASLLLLPFVANKLHIEKKDIRQLLLLGLLGVTGEIGFLNLGLLYSASINAPVVGSAAPVFLIVGGVLFFKEKIKSKVVLGTLVSLTGVLVVVLRPVFERGLDVSLLGNLLFVLHTIANISYTLILHKIAKKYDILTLSFWTFFIGSLGFLPFVGHELMNHPLTSQLTMQGLIGLLYGIILSGAIGYSCFAYGLKYILASDVGVFMYVDPIVSVMVAVPLLGEQITFYFIIGSLLVFAGIFIAEGRLHYHPFHLLARKE